MLESNITYQPFYNNLPILTDQERHLGCHTEILDRISTLFEYMLSKHCKVLFMRFDVRFPQFNYYPDDNTLFEKFIAGFIKHLKRQSLDPYYLWVRERSREKHHHYHCILWLNGGKTRYIYSHLQKAEELWNRTLGLSPTYRGLIDYCMVSRDGQRQRNGIMLNRHDPELPAIIASCYAWGSYLSKANTKESIPGIRQWSSSLLPAL
ncbi:MAG: inovirus-type Gp2 protein [Victivallaceae bacterium]|nr:inovirus-type Gp2 protein [Victivallaceae bacterium]